MPCSDFYRGWSGCQGSGELIALSSGELIPQFELGHRDELDHGKWTASSAELIHGAAWVFPTERSFVSRGEGCDRRRR